MTRRWTFRAMALVGCLALVAAACGDDDDDAATSETTAAASTETTAAASTETTAAASTETTAAASTETTAASTDTTAASSGGGELPPYLRAELPDTAPPYEGEPSTRGITDTSIRVGGVAQLDFYPGMEDGARARFERANRDGGIHGRTVEFIGIENDGSDAAKNLDLTRNQVESDEVFAMLNTSALQLPATTDYLAEQHVPFFGWAINPGYCYPNWWGFGFNGCLIGTSIGVPGALISTTVKDPVADLLGIPTDEFTVAIFSGDNDAGHAGDALYHKLWTEEQFVIADFVPPQEAGGITDPTPYVNEVLEADPDAVILSTDFGSAIVLKSALRASGYDGPIVDFTTYSPGLLEAQPNVAQGLEGGYTNTQIPPFEEGRPGPQQIADDLAAIGKDPFVTLGASVGYWSADILVQMLEQVGPELNTETFYNAVNIDGFTYEPLDGGIGVVSYPASHFDGTPCAALVKVEDGQYVSAVPFTCYENVEPLA